MDALLFVKVYLFFEALNLINKVLLVSFYPDYPRQVKKGADVAHLLINLPFLIWAAVLVFGR
jgi:hypothetical protein